MTENREPAEKSASGLENSAANLDDSAAGNDELAGKRQRTLTGRVVSARMQKTIAVEVERLVRHEEYGKYIRRTTKLLAHDENGESRAGDLVSIAPCRPMSRRKFWRLVAVIERARA